RVVGSAHADRRDQRNIVVSIEYPIEPEAIKRKVVKANNHGLLVSRIIERSEYRVVVGREPSYRADSSATDHRCKGIIDVRVSSAAELRRELQEIHVIVQSIVQTI